MSFSAELREAAAPVWERQVAHPFVTGIGNGSTPGILNEASITFTRGSPRCAASHSLETSGSSDDAMT